MSARAASAAPSPPRRAPPSAAAGTRVVGGLSCCAVRPSGLGRALGRARAEATTTHAVGGPRKRRRAALLGLVAGGLGMARAGQEGGAGAEEGTRGVSVYFGSGCYWHVQHEFVMAEQAILGREKEGLTARTGYAGGSGTVDVNGFATTCYHALAVPGSEQANADYGRLGHGEVVGMTVPEDKVYDFAVEYFKLLDDNGDRPDKADRGPEYRSLIGLPGGVNGPHFASVKRAADAKVLRDGSPIRLVAGVGSDADTLGKRMVWVYDTDAHPFYQAEVYMQFRDGFFPGEDYPRSYNGLQAQLVRSGSLRGTGCQDAVALAQDGTWRYT